MEKFISLNDLYADYAAGLIKKEQLECVIFERLREDGLNLSMPGWSKEDYEDYFSSMYSRISRSIDIYHETGSSFDAYINAVTRLAAKEFHSHNVQSYIEETAAWIARASDMYAYEREAAYDEKTPDKTERCEVKNPRQLLILILKCASHVSVEFLERAAPRLGMEREDLIALIDRLKDQQRKRKEIFTELQERANMQFSRCILFEKKLEYAVEDSESARLMQWQLERERRRLAKTRNRILRMQRDPPNIQIAQLLGVSKSTVDVALYKLKARNKKDQSSGELPSKNNAIAEDENPSPLST